jgi:ABC-type multidrug transport system fused ATPase/permease subunit
MGTVVAKQLCPTADERSNLLRVKLEQLVVEGKRLSLSLDDMISAVAQHWKRLDGAAHERHPKSNDLSKRFRKTVVLDHLNMVVPENSVYGLIGPNGAGKTLRKSFRKESNPLKTKVWRRGWDSYRLPALKPRKFRGL